MRVEAWRIRGAVALGAAFVVLPAPAAVPGSGETTAIPRVETPTDATVAAWLDARVVRVESDACGRRLVGAGVLSGSTIITNRHVVAGASEVTVVDHDGAHSVRAMRFATGIDVAVLEGTDLWAEPIDRNDGAAPGAPVWTRGYPDAGPAVTVASNLRRRRMGGIADPAQVWELDTAVRPGQSGSPVIDSRRRLVGLIYASSFEDDAGLAMDASTVVSGAATASAVPFSDC